MLLQILGTLEGLATEFAFVWFQGNMDSNVRGNVVALDRGGTALTPSAGQVEVVCRLATNMAFTNMFLVMIRCCTERGEGEGSTYIEGFW